MIADQPGRLLPLLKGKPKPLLPPIGHGPKYLLPHNSVFRRSPFAVLQPGAGRLSDVMKRPCQKQKLLFPFRKPLPLPKFSHLLTHQPGVAVHIPLGVVLGILLYPL